VTTKPLVDPTGLEEGHEGLLGLLALHPLEPEPLSVAPHDHDGPLADLLALDGIGLARTINALVQLLIRPFALATGLSRTNADPGHNLKVWT